jgi:hypothetical protein
MNACSQVHGCIVLYCILLLRSAWVLGCLSCVLCPIDCYLRNTLLILLNIETVLFVLLLIHGIGYNILEKLG